MLLCLVNKLKSLILGTLNLISKILCCWRRKRRNSSDIPVSVNVANTASKFASDVAAATNWDDDDWDNCEIVIDKQNSEPKTTSDHIAAYREQMASIRQHSVSETEEEIQEPDLFADMIPDIKKQKKVFVGKDSPRHRDFGSRLSAQNIDPLITRGAELENWEDSANTGWEYDDDDMNEALKSHRRGKR